MPGVTFRLYKEGLASARYRGHIPAQQLAKTVPVGRDWLVCSKHNWEWDEVTHGYGRVCFDVCDDHFADQWASHYRDCIARADLVTCNSRAMAALIFKECGVIAQVIPDPYEQPECPPRFGEGALWFGHASNLNDIAPYVGRFPLEIVTNKQQQGITEWSPETMNAAFERAGFVVIPTGKSMAKSGNRAIESIRRGLFVISGHLPAYSELGGWIGDIEEGINWASNHQDEVLRRIKASQAYVRDEFSPERIGAMWAEALCIKAS